MIWIRWPDSSHANTVFCCVIETCVEGVLHHTVNMV